MAEKVVYILGAGFSAPLGLPVMANFISKSKDMYSKEPEKCDYFKAIYTMLNNMAIAMSNIKIDLKNIEEVLSILEMQNFVKDEKLADTFKNYIVDVIKHYTPDFDLVPLSYRESMPGNWYDMVFGGRSNSRQYYTRSFDNMSLLYSRFIASLGVLEFTVSRDHFFINFVNARRLERPDATYSVITLNYDMVMENIVSNIAEHIQVNDKSSLLPPISKLHGCVSGKPEIIPPTWNKLMHEDIRKEWSNAFSCLKSANHIRFIGYSAPISDTYIKYLLSVGINEAFNLKSIDVVCRDRSGEVEKRYKHIFQEKDFRFVNKTTEEYLYNISYYANGGAQMQKVTFADLEINHNRFFEEHYKYSH